MELTRTAKLLRELTQEILWRFPHKIQTKFFLDFKTISLNQIYAYIFIDNILLYFL